MIFQEALQIGKTGENRIAQYFLRMGYFVLPIYEKVDDDHKGPVLFSSISGALVAPDMLVFKGRQTLWIEAKHKTAFTWHRKTEEWVTGINLHHYQQYLTIQNERPEWPIWLLFLHHDGTAKDTPPGKISPTGLFGNALSCLRENEHHRHSNYGTSGMVYWGVDTLKYLAPLCDLLTPKPKP
ncbi:hypothetical protein GL267_003035 [Acidithiobacillus ferrianus]|uniref:Uncharacterized protein n=2 Tax=Acidithiobacillus ferrianus TaxID=2678518 RepID=A0A845U6R9_9PROT|nr:hypothetical protein [Acidithiobacillus ferrianus]NDU43352.1 hypothetical protein [Acidithiobacillus ferrianus]